MNKADEALADVRRWLCDNLGDGDAGKVCGMLSVVSRRIAEIEEENAKLRELARDYHMFEHGDCHSCRYHDECRKDESCRCIAPMRLADRLRELGVEAEK
jgi:hypothetical protein